MPAITEEGEIRRLLSNAKRINRESFEHYNEHFDALQDTYGGHIVAIVDSHVEESIEHPTESEDLQAFVRMVREEYGDEAFITYIPEPESTMIL